MITRAMAVLLTLGVALPAMAQSMGSAQNDRASGQVTAPAAARHGTIPAANGSPVPAAGNPAGTAANGAPITNAGGGSVSAADGTSASATKGAASAVRSPNALAANDPRVLLSAIPMTTDAGGMRTTRLVGLPVYNDKGQKIGSVDDVIIGADRSVHVVLSVGGMLGFGAKLVDVPYHRLQFSNTGGTNDNRVVLSGVTKESLTEMPDFHYSRAG